VLEYQDLIFSSLLFALYHTLNVLQVKGSKIGFIRALGMVLAI